MVYQLLNWEWFPFWEFPILQLRDSLGIGSHIHFWMEIVSHELSPHASSKWRRRRSFHFRCFEENPTKWRFGKRCRIGWYRHRRTQDDLWWYVGIFLVEEISLDFSKTTVFWIRYFHSSGKYLQINSTKDSFIRGPFLSVAWVELLFLLIKFRNRIYRLM